MASTQTVNKSEATRTVGLRRLVKYGLFAVLAASIVNILVLVISLAVVEFPADFVGGPFGPLAIGPVVINSAVAAVGATLVYGVITRYAARPNRTFVSIAAIALVLSFAMFLAPDIAGAPLRVFTVLAVMHVTAAIIIVGILTRTTTSVEGQFQ
jgi:hypothetical protein